MGYIVLIGVVYLTIGLVVTGEALALGVVAWSVVHLVRGRPKWYVRKMAKGGSLGALLGLGIALAILLPAQGGLPGDSLYLLRHLILSGFGWAAIAPARWYAADRLETSGAPV
jgi:hypothetical protein